MSVMAWTGVRAEVHRVRRYATDRCGLRSARARTGAEVRRAVPREGQRARAAGQDWATLLPARARLAACWRRRAVRDRLD
eukprot:7698355-Heterocapsa_arctica.AAC.1